MTNKILFLSIMSFMILFVACDDDPKPNQPPLLVIAANPASGMLPLSVTFTASGQDPEGTQLNYNWNFGDGKGTSTQQNPVYVYTDAGTFTATCTVTDSGSAPQSATSTVTIEVLGQKPSLSSISPAGCVMHAPSFTLTVTGSSFHQDAKIVFNDVEMDTTFISSKKLICTIQPDDTVLQTLLGSGLNTIFDNSTVVKVKIINPGANGGESDTADFTVHSNYEFESPITISTETDSCPPGILIDGGGRLNIFFSRYDIRHTQSTDNGNTWSAYTTVFNDSYFYDDRSYYACKDAGDNLHIAYTGPAGGYSFSAYSDIWLASLLASSSSWQNQNLTSDWSFEPGGVIPSLTTLNDTLVVMFGLAADYGGNYLTLIRPPWDQCTRPDNMNHGEKDIDHSFVADRSGNLHFAVITYTYNTGKSINVIHFAGNSDLSSYSSTHIISPTDGYAQAVTIVSDPDGILYAFWLDGSTYNGAKKLYFSRSIDGGHKWSKRKILSPEGGYHFISAQTDEAGNIIIVFSKEDYGLEKIYFFRSIDGGRNWTASKKVSEQDGRTSWQSFNIDSSSRLHVVWNNSTGVYYARSTMY